MDSLRSEREFHRRQSNALSARVSRIRKEQRHSQAEETLRESKEELEAIFNQVRDGIVVLDLTGKILKINKRITDATGYTEEDIVGKRFNLLKIFTPQSIAKMLFRFSKSLAGIEILPYEVEGYTKNGERRVAEISGSLLRRGGKAAGVITVMRDITERKRAEEALGESEKRFKIIFDTQQHGTLIISAQSHVIVDVNTYAARIIGLSREDIIGKICHSFICPAEKGQCPVSDLGQAIEQSERTLIQTGGNRIPILKSITKTTINGEELFIESFQDITERKRIEEALQSAYASLKESETRYRTLVDNINMGINLIDVDHNIIMTNTAEGKQFRKPVSELIGKKCFREFEKRDGVCPHCPGVQAMATGQPAEAVTEGVRDDGSRSKARIQAFPAFGYDGTILGFIETSEDITDRVRAETALRESEERFRSLYTYNPSMYFTVNAEGMVLSVNQYVSEQLGYKANELVGQSVLNIFYEHDKNAVRQQLMTCIQHPTEVFHWEFRKVRKNGNIIWVKEAARAVLGVDGKLVILIVCEDITERKQAEEDLRESSEKLKKGLELTVKALASTVEMRDPYTAGHQQRVADLSCAIAKEMGLSDDQIHGIRFAGIIHDIGKINIPAEILNKPGELKEIEYSFLKSHSQAGFDLLKNIEFPWPVAQIVLQHHERIDGSGYPQGLSGSEIILEARILAVADIVEAIATHRPYRPARGLGDALEEILHNKGIFYDPDVVDACLRVFYEKGFTFK